MTVDKNDQQRVEPSKQTGRKWVVGLLITPGLIFMVVVNLAFWAYFTLINPHIFMEINK